MIVDSFQNAHLYPFGDAWNKVFTFLNTLDAHSEEKRYTIQGDDIFALVMSYETKTEENAVLESHEQYVDIQSVLSGVECFGCYESSKLNVLTPYDKDKDITFYYPSHPRHTLITITPKMFVMFAPQDAHMPALALNDHPEQIKKVVVKINKKCLY